MKPRYPKAIGSFLHKQSTFEQLAAKSREFDDLLQQVRTLLPAPLGEHCSAAIKRDKTLILYTVSSAWASRLRFISRQLTGQLKGKGMQIEKISVRVQLQRQPQKRPPRRIRNLSGENATLIEQLADHIEDDKLSAALRRLSRHKNRQHKC